jgi:hypothetical protein
VTFETSKPVRGVQIYYSDLDMIGRHYLIFHKKDKKKRQYTVCNCLEHDAYKAYLRIIKAFKTAKPGVDSSTLFQLKPSFLKEGPGNSVSITLKNYKVNGGLSTAITTDKDVYNENETVPNYRLKGPMGKGLNL